MSAILDVLSRSLDANVVSAIGERIGGDAQATGTVVSAAVPLLLSALTRNASQPEGADALHQAVVRDHSGAILDHLPEHLAEPQAANGAGILRHVLGDQEGAIEQGLAGSAGLDAGSVGQILQIVAPIVMGALGKATQQRSLDAGGLASVLGSEQQEVQAAAPDLMAQVGTLLSAGDQGGGGSLLGDILGSLLGRR